MSGSTGSRPLRSRPNAARADGEKAVRARACSGVGGQVSFWVAPQTDTAVRRASMGPASRGSSRRAVRTAGGTGAGGSVAPGCHSPVQSRSATWAYVPRSTSWPIL